MGPEAAFATAVIKSSPALSGLVRDTSTARLDRAVADLVKAGREWQAREDERLDHIASGWGA